MNTKLSNVGCYVLSFVFPLVIITLVFVGLHITPFGDHTLVISDAKALFVSDLSHESRLLHGQEDLLYSFEWGLGLNLAASYGRFLNPVCLLVLLFDITGYAQMYSAVVAVSMALCGLSMYHFLSSAYTYGRVERLIFSTVYALIGFNVAYCFLYTFLLHAQMIPLVALGIRRILHGKRPWLYLLSLAYTIFYSFYFGYIMCFACLALFLMWYFDSADSLGVLKKQVWVNIVGSTICAGLLAAMAWLPALIALSGGRLNQNSLFDLTFNENMALLDTGAKFFVGANTTDELVNGLPNVFVGSFVLFLNITYFVDSQNSKRQKLVRSIPLIAYFITFYINAFSMAMQGFSSTNWFNYRYSFVFSFLMVLIAGEEYAKLRSTPGKDLKRAGIALLVLVVAVFSKRYAFVSGGEMLLSMLILAFIVGAFWWSKKDPVRAPQGQLAVIILILCSIELYANTCICLYNVQEWELKQTTYQEDLIFGSVYSESIQASDDAFYRMEKEHATNKRCSNDPRLFGYNGTSYFGSYEKDFFFRGMGKLGASWYDNRTWYAEGEPASYDALLGIRYIAARRDLAAEKGYDLLVTLGDDTVYRNECALPIGVFANALDVASEMGDNPFANHNALWSHLAGEDVAVFTEEEDVTFVYHSGVAGIGLTKDAAESYSTSVSSILENDSGGGESDDTSDEALREDILEEITQSPYWVECTFVAKQDGPIYAYNGGMADESRGFLLEAMQYVGTYHAGDTVTARLDVGGELTDDLFHTVCADCHIAYANDDVLKDCARRIQEESGILEEVTDSHLEGSLNVNRDGRLFFTIPYDEGWTLKVDGREIPLQMEAGLFMSAPLETGNHSYTLTFFPKGLMLGMVASCIGVVLVILLMAYNRSAQHNMLHAAS